MITINHPPQEASSVEGKNVFASLMQDVELAASGGKRSNGSLPNFMLKITLFDLCIWRLVQGMMRFTMGRRWLAQFKPCSTLVFLPYNLLCSTLGFFCADTSSFGDGLP